MASTTVLGRVARALAQSPQHGVGSLDLGRTGEIGGGDHIAAAVLGIRLDCHGALAGQRPDEGNQAGGAREHEHG